MAYVATLGQMLERQRVAIFDRVILMEEKLLAAHKLIGQAADELKFESPYQVALSIRANDLDHTAKQLPKILKEQVRNMTYRELLDWGLANKGFPDDWERVLKMQKAKDLVAHLHKNLDQLMCL